MADSFHEHRCISNSWRSSNQANEQTNKIELRTSVQIVEQCRPPTQCFDFANISNKYYVAAVTVTVAIAGFLSQYFSDFPILSRLLSIASRFYQFWYFKWKSVVKTSSASAVVAKATPIHQHQKSSAKYASHRNIKPFDVNRSNALARLPVELYAVERQKCYIVIGLEVSVQWQIGSYLCKIQHWWHLRVNEMPFRAAASVVVCVMFTSCGWFGIFFE